MNVDIVFEILLVITAVKLEATEKEIIDIPKDKNFQFLCSLC